MDLTVYNHAKMDFRGWISADGFSHSASVQQRTSRNKLPKIVTLFDEQITFSKTLCKQAFLPLSFAKKYYGTIINITVVLGWILQMFLDNFTDH